jgi:hypothetical protein
MAAMAAAMQRAALGVRARGVDTQWEVATRLFATAAADKNKAKAKVPEKVGRRSPGPESAPTHRPRRAAGGNALAACRAPQGTAAAREEQATRGGSLRAGRDRTLHGGQVRRARVRPGAASRAARRPGTSCGTKDASNERTRSPETCSPTASTRPRTSRWSTRLWPTARSTLTTRTTRTIPQ